MSKKDNFRTAMNEMFGIGGAPAQKKDAAQVEPAKAETAPVKAEEKPAVKAPAAKPATVFRAEKLEATFFAPGTSIEGTLRAKGDVVIAGDFKGDIFSEGKVTLRASTSSNVKAASLAVADCTVTGDIQVTGDVELIAQSVINGNVHATNVSCSGRVNGDLFVKGHLSLNESAQVRGNIKAQTLSIAKGALVSGNVEMKTGANEE